MDGPAILALLVGPGYFFSCGWQDGGGGTTCHHHRYQRSKGRKLLLLKRPQGALPCCERQFLLFPSMGFALQPPEAVELLVPVSISPFGRRLIPPPQVDSNSTFLFERDEADSTTLALITQSPRFEKRQCMPVVRCRSVE